MESRMMLRMEPDQRTALKQLLDLASSPGYMPDLRDVLGALHTEQLYAFQREVKAAIEERVVGAPVVVLTSLGAHTETIQAIKVVREALGLGLREARDMVASGRVPVDGYEKATQLAAKLGRIGYRAEVQTG